MIMKSNVVEYLTDSFVDFKGVEHKFVVCAVSSAPENYDELELAVSYVYDDYASYDKRHYVERMVSIGYSVCNPEDKFNENKGREIAYRKALNNLSNPVLCSSVKGVVNKTLIKALLKQESKFVKENPERIIKGYNDSKARYEKKKKTQEEYNSLNENERNIVNMALEGTDLNKYTDLANKLKNYND